MRLLPPQLWLQLLHELLTMVRLLYCRAVNEHHLRKVVKAVKDFQITYTHFVGSIVNGLHCPKSSFGTLTSTRFTKFHGACIFAVPIVSYSNTQKNTVTSVKYTLLILLFVLLIFLQT